MQKVWKCMVRLIVNILTFSHLTWNTCIVHMMASKHTYYNISTGKSTLDNLLVEHIQLQFCSRVCDKTRKLCSKIASNKIWGRATHQFQMHTYLSSTHTVSKWIGKNKKMCQALKFLINICCLFCHIILFDGFSSFFSCIFSYCSIQFSIFTVRTIHVTA